MPCWSIHFNIAKKLNKILKLDEDLFYFGNILPDIKDIPNVNRDELHYEDIPYSFCPQEKKCNITKFLKDYEDKLNNPMILGYYCHLLTDNFYNEKTYRKCWVFDEDKNIIGIKLKNGKVHNIEIDDLKNEKRTYKHHDFELYGKNIFDANLKPHNKEKIYDNMKYTKNHFLTKEIIDKRFDYLNTKYLKDNKLKLSERILKNNYWLFTKEELDQIFNYCYKYVLKELQKHN